MPEGQLHDTLSMYTLQVRYHSPVSSGLEDQFAIGDTFLRRTRLGQWWVTPAGGAAGHPVLRLFYTIQTIIEESTPTCVDGQVWPMAHSKLLSLDWYYYSANINNITMGITLAILSWIYPFHETLNAIGPGLRILDFCGWFVSAQTHGYGYTDMGFSWRAPFEVIA